MIGARPRLGSSSIKQLRLAHQRAAHRQHLLLAAGQRAGELLAALLEARKQRVDALDRGLRAAAASMRKAPSCEIVLDIHGPEQFAMLGHEAEPARDAILDVEPGRSCPANDTRPFSGRMPMMALSSVVLPAPLAPMMVTISLAPTSSETAAHGLDLAIGDMRVGD